MGIQVPALPPLGYGNHHQSPLSIPFPVDHGRGVGQFFRHNSIVGSALLHHPATLPIHDEVPPSKSALNLARADARRQHATRLARSIYHGQSHSIHHNHVDIGHIREGTDVRTTVGGFEPHCFLKLTDRKIFSDNAAKHTKQSRPGYVEADGGRVKLGEIRLYVSAHRFRQ